jgi:hypothetical protein
LKRTQQQFRPPATPSPILLPPLSCSIPLPTNLHQQVPRGIQTPIQQQQSSTPWTSHRLKFARFIRGAIAVRLQKCSSFFTTNEIPPQILSSPFWQSSHSSGGQWGKPYSSSSRGNIAQEDWRSRQCGRVSSSVKGREIKNSHG